MKTGMYVIYDKVAQECGPLFEAKNDGVAYREYARLREGTENPEDFQLLKMGLFDHETLQMTVVDDPIDVIQDTVIENEVE